MSFHRNVGPVSGIVTYCLSCGRLLVTLTKWSIELWDFKFQRSLWKWNFRRFPYEYYIEKQNKGTVMGGPNES